MGDRVVDTPQSDVERVRVHGNLGGERGSSWVQFSGRPRPPTCLDRLGKEVVPEFT
ncbi:hypothetical protein [Halomarina oriensis]|uniref:Uncharacterized protein n=1 Tax=Halomarina oriensis TaxID=671145 RepID=A0A6B0GK73_9EURY|nr:hypothetical protein [Halomarina oriensis]MWG35010.1 hypothetical protein [Halomarina oriensis]